MGDQCPQCGLTHMYLPSARVLLSLLGEGMKTLSLPGLAVDQGLLILQEDEQASVDLRA